MDYLVFLYHHSNKVPFHGSFEPELVFVRVYNGRHFASVDECLKLALEDLVNRVLLHIVDNPESDLLALGVDEGEQGIVHDVRFGQTERVVVYADVENPVYRVSDGEGAAHESKLEVVVVVNNSTQLVANLLLYESI